MGDEDRNSQPQIIRIYTDGSHRLKNQEGGFAVVMESEDGSYVVFRDGHEERTTNMRMELRAVLTALATTSKDRGLMIHCDCNTIVGRIDALQHGRHIEFRADKDLWAMVQEEVKEWGDRLQMEEVRSRSCDGNRAAHRAARHAARTNGRNGGGGQTAR